MAEVAGGKASGAPIFALSDDDRAIAEMARGFADENLAPHALLWDETRYFPVDVLKKAAELGMAACYVSEGHGGSGLSRMQTALVFEALSTGCPSIAAYLSIHNMVAGMIERFGDQALIATYLPRLVGMEVLAAYCLTEPGSGSDAAALKSRARREGDTYVVDGVKQFISGAGSCDLYAVMVRTGDDGPKGISCLLLEKGMPGLSFGANEKKMGWNAQPTRQVIMDSVRVPVANRLGAEGQGFSIAMSGLDGGRLNISACALGGAQAAYGKARAYLGERQAFGKKLQDFQALQFRIADLAIDLEAARTFLYASAAAYDRQDPDASMRCAMAKRFVTDTASRVADGALQLLGGYGYLSEYGIEKIVRDLRVHQILEGTNEIMRLIVARSILGTR
ncbi:CaiA Acyl-CoA dehydrogenases [Rhabdaerophilaceae bacterium]